MRQKLGSYRGRPTGRTHSLPDNRLLEYLAEISLKYGVDSDKFFKSFLNAFQHQESKCGKLSIKCRGKEKDYAIFLITKDREAVGQFHMPECLLNEKTNPLKEVSSKLSSMRTMTQEAESTSYKIENLKAGMKHLNIQAEVLEEYPPIQITTRHGNQTYIVNFLITDETGVIKLNLFENRIEGVTLHDIVQVENAYVTLFRGERQLRIGKYGKISVVQRQTMA